MRARLFLDTNIFAYSFDETAPKKARIADRLIRKGLDSGNVVVSYQVVQEFFNVALRRFARPFSYPEAEQYLSVIFRPLLTVFPSCGSKVNAAFSPVRISKLGKNLAARGSRTRSCRT